LVGGTSADTPERLLYDDPGCGCLRRFSDMRVLLASTHPHAAEALDLFVYRIGRELGSLAAALGGLDALVFTGGIGENAESIRARVCRDARWLGLELDEEANAGGSPRISRTGSRVSAWVVPTNEDDDRPAQRVLGSPRDRRRGCQRQVAVRLLAVWPYD
jgi:acetate kinase